MHIHIVWDIHRQRKTSLRFMVTVTTMRKNTGITRGPNLRICIDSIFPGFPKYMCLWLPKLLFSPALKSDENLMIPI